MKYDARRALAQLTGRPALIAASHVGTEITSGGLLADMRELAAANPDAEEELAVKRQSALLAAYGYPGSAPIGKPFAFADGKAIIPVHGVLINRFSSSWGFATGYNFVRNQLNAAEADPDVDGIIFDINSYGGMAAGCPETCDAIYAASKPTLGVVDDSCFSAAYMLASGMDKLYVTPSGQVGSIGVLVMHMDVSKMLEEVGIKISYIFAGDHKVDANPYEPLSDDVKSDLQGLVNEIYGTFVSRVVRGREMPEAAVRGTEARIYLANEAFTLGLVNGIAAPDDAAEAFFNSDDEDEAGGEAEDDPDDDNDTHMESNMPKPSEANETQPGQAAAGTQTAASVDPAIAANAAAEARVAERARISGITGHAEAKGRETLANHLALNTDMSVEAAAGILAASPKQEAAPAAAPAKTEATSDNHFQRAMDNSKHPNVGAGAEGGTGEDESGKPVNRILAAQTKATGRREPVKQPERPHSFYNS